jgi:hypothetical protein
MIKVAARPALWSLVTDPPPRREYVVPRPEGAPRDDLDSDAQEFLKILNQTDAIKKGGSCLEVHEQV